MKPTKEYTLQLTGENSSSYSWLESEASSFGTHSHLSIASVDRSHNSSLRRTSFYLTPNDAEALIKILQAWVDAHRAYMEGR